MHRAWLRALLSGKIKPEQDALRNLDGPGWHLERDRFDAWLAGVARERGATMLADARLASVRRERHAGAEWRLDVDCGGRPLAVGARLLVDASGRDAVLAKRFGGQRQACGKLVCGWVFGHDGTADTGTGATDLHAERDGWWYSASLPGRRRLLAFHTDADLPAARSAHSPQGLIARLAAVPPLRALLAEMRFEADGAHGFCAAHGVVHEQPWDADWLSVGDAALAFDPLSSQGLFNALYTGLAGAEAAYRCLDGCTGALAAYGADLDRVRRTYRAHLDAWYRSEQRWPRSPFWQRRHDGYPHPVAPLADPSSGAGLQRARE